MKVKEDGLKAWISTKLLDLAEILPGAKAGPIFHLQGIRERQRNWADDDYERTRPPEDADLKLNRLNISFIFQYEDFQFLPKGVKSLLPTVQKVDEFLDNFDKSIDEIHAAGWSNLGSIVRDSYFLIDNVISDKLPEAVDKIHISYSRVLPSMAIIEFNCYLTDEAIHNITCLQNNKYISTTVFKRFWPLSRLPHGWSQTGGSDGAAKAIIQYKNVLRNEIIGWIRKETGWGDCVTESVACVDVFELEGNPVDAAEFEKWKEKYRGWLNDFGLMTNGFDSYYSENALYSFGTDKEDEFGSVDKMVIVNNLLRKNSDHSLSHSVRALAIAASYRVVFKQYRMMLQEFRAKGFKGLFGRKPNFSARSTNLQSVKKIAILLDRLRHELEKNNSWFVHQTAEVGHLSSYWKEDELIYHRAILENTTFQLEQLIKTTNVLDAGLTGYLSVQNIHVMFKLQRRMYALSIIVGIATIVSLAANWTAIKLQLSSWWDDVVSVALSVVG